MITETDETVTDTFSASDAERDEIGLSKLPGRRRLMVIGLVGLLLLGAGASAALGWWPGQKADVRSGTTLVTADGMAARYGIDVNLIGVTAAGGLIEFRYQVVDPDKADIMIHNDKLLPIVVVEDSGATMVISRPHHASEIKLGATYFFLFANAHNAIHAGSEVTLVMGGYRIEHIKVQG